MIEKLCLAKNRRLPSIYMLELAATLGRYPGTLCYPILFYRFRCLSPLKGMVSPWIRSMLSVRFAEQWNRGALKLRSVVYLGYLTVSSSL